MSINIIVQLLSDNTTTRNIYSKMLCRNVADISPASQISNLEYLVQESGLLACDFNKFGLQLECWTWQGDQQHQVW
jgi:hypothetical protein